MNPATKPAKVMGRSTRYVQGFYQLSTLLRKTSQTIHAVLSAQLLVIVVIFWECAILKKDTWRKMLTY
jgi:hypothetical protein